jgi:ribosomal protein S27E
VSDVYRCRREARCANRTQAHTTDGPAWVGAASSRVLCDTCASDLLAALAELPTLLGLLEDERPRSLGVVLESRVGGTVDPRKIPIREDVDALQHAIVDTARCWEEIVRDVAGDAPPERRPARALLTPASGPSVTDRMRASLIGSVSLLRARLPVLLALTPTEVERDGDWTTLDGGDACLELLDLHHRARKHVGQWRRVTHYPNDPCPACGVPAITHLDGSDVVRCGSCGETETWERWAASREAQPA